MEIICKNRTQ